MKILFVGDSPTVNTGFGIVAKNLLKRFRANGHEIIVLGINHFGDPYDPKEFPYPIYPVERGSIEMMYGYDKFWPIQAAVKPDIIFFLNDPWIIYEYMKRKPSITPPAKIVAYYPTDGGPIKQVWMNMLNTFDAQVCYSNFAEGVAIESNKGIRPANLHQIYHGVNRDVFKPLNQKVAKNACGIAQDKFVIGMVARNQPRKRFDILCKAFAEFAKDKPEAMLYLHTSKVDVGWDIDEMVGQLGLKNRVYITEAANPVKGVTDEELNVIYNTFDINALISLGDGFGLPVAESMATGCPQIVSDHSCLKELVEGHGGLTVKNAAWVMNVSGINTWGGLTDVGDLVAKFNLLYSNEELRYKLAENGLDFIRQDQFTWDYAAEEFEKIFRTLFHLLERSRPYGTTDKAVAHVSAA